MVRRKASRIPRASSVRNPTMLPPAAMRESSGSDTVPSATPNIPSGSCIRRNAYGQPGDRPVAEMGREHRIDEHVHLGGAGSDHRGDHEPEDGLHALVPPMEVGPEAIAQASERRQLHPELHRPADQCSEREPQSRPHPEMRIDEPADAGTGDDGAHVEEARGGRGNAEDVLRVQHPHDERRQRDQQDEREHDARQRHGQRRLLGRESAARSARRSRARR